MIKTGLAHITNVYVVDDSYQVVYRCSLGRHGCTEEEKLGKMLNVKTEDEETGDVELSRRNISTSVATISS